MSEWANIELRNIFDLSIAGEWGDAPDGINDTYILRAADFTKDCKLKAKIGAARIVPKAKLLQRKLVKGDLLLEKSGGSPTQPVGRVDNYSLSNFLQLLRVNQNYDSLWTYYLLTALYDSNVVLRYQQQTTGIINFKLEEYLSETIDVPLALIEQQKIAKILSTVDNLIDKTKSLIDKYTAIKQGMMADLFTRGIDMTTGDTSNAKGGKLRPSVEDVPELYKQTELGWVPKEWEVIDLGSIANVDRGKFTHRPRDDARCYGGDHPFIQTGSVTKAKGGFITEYKQTLSEFGRSVSREFSAGTIAVTIAANIADTGILNIPMCFPDSIVGVNVDEDKALIRFVEITIRRNKQRLDAIAPLSAQKNINLEDLRPLKLALPALSEQIEICKRYEANERLIQKEADYFEKLKKQKKGLMQDLLTGKVRVN
jgi:type I restriction enzyme S subunit